MKRLLHVIADYRPMSQEFGEILQRIWAQNWDLDLVVPSSVPSLDTVGTGYLTAQLALGENPPGTVLYVNTAPRKERKEAMTDNAGEQPRRPDAPTARMVGMARQARQAARQSDAGSPLFCYTW
jgi:hypothetical protein